MPVFYRRTHPQAGYNLVEVMIAAAIMGITAQAFFIFSTTMRKANTSYTDRMLAQQKALQMLDEVKKMAQAKTSANKPIAQLDYLDDGASFRYTLTTDFDMTMTTDASGNSIFKTNEYLTANLPLSGNPIASTKQGYNWVRNIAFKKVDSDPTLRKVWIQIYRALPNPGSSAASTPAKTGPLAAEAFGIVRSGASPDIPMQALDIYLIAIENVPGWWMRLASVRPLMSNIVNSMQAVNPGLEIRPHWIQRLSFGRDWEYTPETNRATKADTTNLYKKTYVYPGNVTYDDTPYTPALYYEPDYFKARMNADGAIERATSYALADQFNHPMRYPDEMNAYAQMANDNNNAQYLGDSNPEISLRMLLEGLNNPKDSNSPLLKNSIIVNLHGEMMPILALRNVSDPAKDPTEFPTKPYRAVTHPEQLVFDTSKGETPTLRVYAYEAVSGGGSAPEGDAINVVTLFIPGMTCRNLSDLQGLTGSSTVMYNWNSRFNGCTSCAGVIADSTPAQYSGDPRPYWISSTARDWDADWYQQKGLRIHLYGVSATARAFWNNK